MNRLTPNRLTIIAVHPSTAIHVAALLELAVSW